MRDLLILILVLLMQTSIAQLTWEHVEDAYEVKWYQATGDNPFLYKMEGLYPGDLASPIDAHYILTENLKEEYGKDNVKVIQMFQDEKVGVLAFTIHHRILIPDPAGNWEMEVVSYFLLINEQWHFVQYSWERRELEDSILYELQKEILRYVT